METRRQDRDILSHQFRGERERERERELRERKIKEFIFQLILLRYRILCVYTSQYTALNVIYKLSLFLTIS